MTASTSMHQRHAVHKHAPPVFLGVLVHGGSHTDALFCQAFFHRRSHQFGIIGAVRDGAEFDLGEFAVWDPEQLHELRAAEEPGLVVHAGRRDEGVADLAGDREGTFLVADLDNHLIADIDAIKRTVHALDTQTLFQGPDAGFELDDIISLGGVIIAL